MTLKTGKKVNSKREKAKEKKYFPYSLNLIPYSISGRSAVCSMKLGLLKHSAQKSLVELIPSIGSQTATEICNLVVILSNEY